MTEVLCGKVSPEERDEIQRLFKRKVALQELVLTLGKADPATVERLYERVLGDMGETATAFRDWWAAVAARYGWAGFSEAGDGARWKINFETCEVSLQQ